MSLSQLKTPICGTERLVIEEVREFEIEAVSWANAGAKLTRAMDGRIA